MRYKFKTKPFEHQLTIFNNSRDLYFYGLLAEQGTGKSKIIIDTAAYLFTTGKIDAMFIIAPNGVHYNWVANEIPAHMPDAVNWRAAVWHSTMNKTQREEFNLVFEQGNHLRIVAANVEAYSTESKKAAIMTKQFLSGMRVLLVLDEAHKIKKPGAKRTKTIMRLSRSATYRRIATGTAITKGPLDLYTQMRFLSDAILGYDNYYSFRARYAQLKEMTNPITGKKFQTVTGYLNLDELTCNIAPHTVRVLKSECLDLPPKLYERRYVELGKEQKRYYNDMRKHLLVELHQGQCTAQIALTKLLRLQQIVGGFLPVDEGAVYAIKDNRRIDAVLDILEGIEGKVIIWAKFRAEITAIKKAIELEYGRGWCCEYHGGVSKDDRAKAMQAFQNDVLPNVFIANQQTGGTGLTLHAASHVIYYSNDFSLELRLQSEDRAHRIGQSKSVTYYDLEAQGTIDTRVINVLREKKELAQIIMQDPMSEWI